MSQNLIAAIEIGSQQVSAIIGRKEPDGQIHVIAAAQESSSKYVRRGQVVNLDLMTQSLNSIVERLERQAHKAVNQVYVTVGGLGLHSMFNQVTINYTEPTKITAEIVDSILDDNLNSGLPGYRILDVLPQEYRIDSQTYSDPVGVESRKLVGDFQNVIIPVQSLERLESSFRAANLPISEMLVAPLYLANNVLTDAERLSGCAFVDMGADTTTVAIFEAKVMRFLTVLPLGGNNVTRDLMTELSIEESEAEEIKRRYGRAYLESPDGTPVEHDNIRLHDGRSIPYNDVLSIIEARMSEIVQNVANIIKNIAKYSSERLIGGLVLTGGASNMTAVDRAMIEYTHIRKLRFVKNTPTPVRAPKITNFNIDGTYNGVLAILDVMTENCCSDEKQAPGIFDEQPSAEELERKRQEEEAAARAAAEAEAAAQAAAAEAETGQGSERVKAIVSGFKKLLRDMFTDETKEEE